MSAMLPPLLVTGRVRRALDNATEISGVDALLVVSPENIRWLTGFSGSVAILVINNNDAALIVDGRYRQQATHQVHESGAQVRVVEARTQATQMAQVVTELSGIERCGFDPSELTVQAFDEYVASCRCTFVPTAAIIQQLRRIKSDSEVARIVLAAKAADAALRDVEILMQQIATSSTGSNLTERDVRDELEYKMRRYGADGPSYDTIVATGANSVKPHHRPTSTIIQEGDSVVIDVGGLVDGYHSDMTRTYLIGQVAPELAQIHALVLASQATGVRAVRAGVTASSIDAICRGVIADAGYGPDFIHGTGHGVGLKIHELPWLRADFVEPLQVGEVVTVEPGVYRVGVGGVRIEDLLLVSATSSQTLTSSQKESLCLPSQQTI